MEYKINVYNCLVKLPSFLDYLGQTEKHKGLNSSLPQKCISPAGTGRHIVPQEPWTVTWKTYVACLSRQLGQLHDSLHILMPAHMCTHARIHTEAAAKTFLCGWIFDNPHLIFLEYLKWPSNDFLLFPPRVGKEWMQTSEAHI